MDQSQHTDKKTQDTTENKNDIPSLIHSSVKTSSNFIGYAEEDSIVITKNSFTQGIFSRSSQNDRKDFRDDFDVEAFLYYGDPKNYYPKNKKN